MARELTPEEVAAGYIRPVRDRYTHERCGVATVLSANVAASFATMPGGHYGKIWCAKCRDGFPAAGFVWDDGDKVGS